jgi:glycosyltransferase involved in cell wall biosynthesis
MKKILIIGPFPNPISGVSLANQTVNQVLNSTNDFKTSVINTSYPYFEDSVGSFSLKKAFFFLKLNIQALKILKNDIIYFTPGQTFFGILKYALFILISSIFNKELVIHIHGNYLGTQYKLLKGIKKKIFYFLVKRSDKGIVLSPSLMDNLTPFISKKNIYVLYNFAENYLSENTKELKEENNTCLKISYLSNLMEEKGIFYLLDSLKELERLNINYKAKIAGNIDSKLKETILEKISLLKNTSYHGVVYGVEKKKLLDWSTIFVLPTYYKMEGQPISILEAMATNNLIITTNHSGIADIVKDKVNGFLVKKQSSESITKALIHLNENKLEIIKITKENKVYFSENFTIEKFKKEIINIFSQKCNN